VADRLGIELAAGPEVSTLAGLVTERLGRIPRPGDTVTVPGFELKVVEMRGRRVTKVLAVAKPEAGEPAVAGARGGG
jgi:putative hemolysin